jgi:poly-gamma-glutamate capsule biosynthesis protein CapA/YwtB (metallophosphatase superfamily)
MARSSPSADSVDRPARNEAGDAVRLFLCGDVMTGRGVDQVLPHPGRPELHEAYARSADAYVQLAEEHSGPIARPVAFDYIWGDMPGELATHAPDARIVNLETAVTGSDDAWPGKAIHYRMHPGNLPCLAVAGIDCCVLANNHVLDWGRDGLCETLAVLHASGIATAGAGHDADEAGAPAVLPLRTDGRLLVFGMALSSSGIPGEWAAAPDRPGVNLLTDTSLAAIEAMAHALLAWRQAGDVVVASIHWGGNWGYRIPAAHRRLAHGLIDAGAVDLVHGHSSHHPLGVEVYRGRLVLYGCGDLLNDYEGIPGYEQFRPDLSLLYLPSLERGTGNLARLELVPMQVRRFRLARASADDARWLANRLTRVSRRYGTRIEAAPDDRLMAHWTED